jgi:transposase
MVRHYKRKGKTPWPDKDKRMAAAVRKRVESKSLRQIAKELSVSAPTVMRDLRRWDELHPNVFQMPVTSRPAGGDLKQPHETPEESIPRIRRVK